MGGTSVSERKVEAGKKSIGDSFNERCEAFDNSVECVRFLMKGWHRVAGESLMRLSFSTNGLT